MSNAFSTTVLALLVTIGFFATLTFLATKGIPDNATTKDVILILVGALSVQFANVINYYFGSSQGSRDKSAVMSAALERTTTVSSTTASPPTGAAP